MIAQAAGNALFLEELIRVVADGNAGARPRRCWRCCRLAWGDCIPRCGDFCVPPVCSAACFIAAGARARRCREWPGAGCRFAELCELEILQPHAESVLNGESAYAFRHDLVRDAAYALLPEADRELGHYLRRAIWKRPASARRCCWPSTIGGVGRPRKRRTGIAWLPSRRWKPARWGGAEASADGSGCRGGGVERGLLLLLLANAAYWLRQYDQTRKAAEQALGLLTVGSTDYFHCAAQLWCRAVGCVTGRRCRLTSTPCAGTRRQRRGAGAGAVPFAHRLHVPDAGTVVADEDDRRSPGAARRDANPESAGGPGPGRTLPQRLLHGGRRCAGRRSRWKQRFLRGSKATTCATH